MSEQDETAIQAYVRENNVQMVPDEAPDLTQPIYATSPESLVMPTVGDGLDDEETEMQAEDYDLFTVLHRIENKVDGLIGTTDGVRTGVNTIGEMMNSIADAVGQVMQKVQTEGLAGLVGGLMGGKKNG